MISPEVLLSLILLFAAPPPAEPLRSIEDLAGLHNLRASLEIRSSDWPLKTDPCSNWTGLRCRSGRVVSLDLTGLRRTHRGQLSPSFAIDGVRNLTALERLAAAGFPLPGPIPEWLGSGLPASLAVLVLRSATISGDIPYTLGAAGGLRVLSLPGNAITGNIPHTLGSITNLSSLDLSGNFLSGSIPSELAALQNLSYLNLSSNFLSGAISPSFGMLSKLKTLAFAGNSLEGNVPVQLSNLSQLESLDLSSNSLVGDLPEVLFSVVSHLHSVNISHNYFSGALPNSTWSLSELEYLDISSNNLTGILPELATRNVNSTGAVFNLSYNLFYGLLSPEIGLFFQKFNTVDLSNNYLEGSEPFGNKGKNVFFKLNCFNDAMNQRSSDVCENFYKERDVPFVDFVAPAPAPGTSFSDRRSSHKWSYILAGVVGGLGVLIAAYLLAFFCLKRPRNQTNSQGEPAKDWQPPPYRNNLVNSPGIIGDPCTYEQLIEATSDFSSMNLIKHGHSGDLYHGILKGRISVVVKRVDVHVMKRESHLVEMDLFAKDLNGRLVPFVGHCFEKENEKFLIYKFMPYRDLSMALHSALRPGEEGLKSLDWIARLKIATMVAEALCFLHHECNPPLVHRDIQSSSILIDEKFEVHLGSLSEVCIPEGDTHQNFIAKVLRRSPASGQGTSGSPATCAHDIYCFGKVMLELITGKLGISSSNDPTHTEWMDSIQPFINRYDKDIIANIIDPTLVVDDDLLEEVWAMAVMARCCLKPKPHKRPLARHLLKALQNPVKVVREESFSGSGPLRSTSSRSSSIGAFVGGWMQSSSEMESISGQLGRDHSVRQASTARSQGSLGDHSFSRIRTSREVFPEPNGTSAEDIE